MIKRQERDVGRDPDAVGHRGDGPGQRLEGGQVSVFQEMVFGEPHQINAQLVGQLHLFEGGAIHRAHRLAATRPDAAVVHHSEANRLNHGASGGHGRGAIIQP